MLLSSPSKCQKNDTAPEATISLTLPASSIAHVNRDDFVSKSRLELMFRLPVSTPTAL